MGRMGKRQELWRIIRFISILAFVMVLQLTWENMLPAAQYGLINGETVRVIWMSVGVIVGALCMIASMLVVLIWLLRRCLRIDELLLKGSDGWWPVSEGI